MRIEDAKPWVVYQEVAPETKQWFRDRYGRHSEWYKKVLREALLVNHKNKLLPPPPSRPQIK